MVGYRREQPVLHSPGSSSPRRMAQEPKTFSRPLSSSSIGVSGPVPVDNPSQLSAQKRVETSVSTAAMDRGVLMAPAGSPPAGGFSAAMAGLEAFSDAEVMVRVKAGDQSAFDYLVQKYRRPLVGFMYRMARNAAAAEDLAQEVFLRVYRSRETYEPSAKFATWLYRIATNLAVNHARDTRHERPENTVSLDEPDEESGRTLDLPDGTPSAEENLMHRERLAGIRQRVQALPERQRIAVVMHKYQ